MQKQVIGNLHFEMEDAETDEILTIDVKDGFFTVDTHRAYLGSELVEYTTVVIPTVVTSVEGSVSVD